MYKFISVGDNPWVSCKLIQTLEPLERKVFEGSSKLAPIETLEWGD